MSESSCCSRRACGLACGYRYSYSSSSLDMMVLQVFSAQLFTGRKNSETGHGPRVKIMICSSPSRQSTRRCHRCCMCILPTLRRKALLAFAATWRWHGLATRVVPVLSCSLVWCKPSARCATCMCGVDLCCLLAHAKLSLARGTCGLSWPTLLFDSKPKNPNPIQYFWEDLGPFGPFWVPFFGKLLFLGIGGIELGQTQSEFEQRKHTNIAMARIPTVVILSLVRTT